MRAFVFAAAMLATAPAFADEWTVSEGLPQPPKVICDAACQAKDAAARAAAVHVAHMMECDKLPTWVGVLLCRHDNP